jgi:PRC-barrel domain
MGLEGKWSRRPCQRFASGLGAASQVSLKGLVCDYYVVCRADDGSVSLGAMSGTKAEAMPHTLVPSDQVEGAPVFGSDGAKVGTIERLMLDKRSGTVAYAVVKTPGRLLAGHHYPLPWGALKYNPTRHAYETDVTLEALHSGPSELDGEAFDWGDRSRTYKNPHYWDV